MEEETLCLLQIFRSSRSEVLCKKCVLRNFPKFTGKHLCQSLFFNKVARQQIKIDDKKKDYTFLLKTTRLKLVKE